MEMEIRDGKMCSRSTKKKRDYSRARVMTFISSGSVEEDRVGHEDVGCLLMGASQ